MVVSSVYVSVVGKLEIILEGDVLVGLDFIKIKKVSALKIPPARVKFLKKVTTQLDEYFTGKRRDFTFPLSKISQLPGTDFQKSVWKEIAKIPYGKTKSYLEIARAIGNPEAVRAVANACGANPLAIVIPCHRVTGTGWLGGYGGGVENKKKLLKLENIEQ